MLNEWASYVHCRVVTYGLCFFTMCVPVEGRCGLGLLLPVFSLVVGDFSPLSDLDYLLGCAYWKYFMVHVLIRVGLLRLGSLDGLRFASDSKFGPQPGFDVASLSGGWFYKSEYSRVCLNHGKVSTG